MLSRSVLLIGITLLVGVFFLFTLSTSHNTLIGSVTANSPTAVSSAATAMPVQSQMKLTAFDKKLAIQLMDKDSDGKCDSCGMPVEMCADSGQVECNMDPNSTMGVLGSRHIHADFKVYIKGQALDFSPYAHMERMQLGQSVSSFMHVDSGSPAPEKTGDVLHMHATGIPLWIFFESLGMEFTKNCFNISAGEKYCRDGKNSLKFFVNGQPNPEFENYVFSDGDKILINYGNETPSQLQSQLNSITDFAHVHSEK